MSKPTSYQLPNLLAIGRAFELRTNPHCWPVSRASESWLLSQSGALTEKEHQQVKETKGGLLTALSFPTCDAPQLRIMMDFLNLMMLEQSRALAGQRVWEGESPGPDAGWDEGLERNVLFRLVIPSLRRLLRKTSASWNRRFSASVQAFRTAQLQLQAGAASGTLPDVEAYIELRRAASGIELIFNLVEPLLDLHLPESDPTGNTPADIRRREGCAMLKKLRQCAGDIVAWSVDIASHNHTQSLPSSPPTLVDVLIASKHLSLQPAINHAATLVKQSLDSFLETERLLLAGPLLPSPELKPVKRHTKRWSWFFSPSEVTSSTALNPEENLLRAATSRRAAAKRSSWWSSSDEPALDFSAFSPAAPTPDNKSWWTPEEEEDVQAFITSLKDCISGTVNWLYENEVFFGDKAEEVKSFGWVFLKPKAPTTATSG